MDFPEYEDPQEMECFSCGVQVNINKQQHGPHLAAHCNVCGIQIRNLKKLKNLHKKPAKNNEPLKRDKYSRGFAFCALCYRAANFIIEKTGQDLEVHHIREVRHDGTDDPENLLMLCHDCHNTIHSIRMISNRNLNTWKK